MQAPNAPLIVALAGSLVHGATDGDVADVAWVLSRAALVTWALLELLQGTNAFRRVLGAAALVWVGAGLL